MRTPTPPSALLRIPALALLLVLSTAAPSEAYYWGYPGSWLYSPYNLGYGGLWMLRSLINPFRSWNNAGNSSYQSYPYQGNRWYNPMNDRPPMDVGEYNSDEPASNSGNHIRAHRPSGQIVAKSEATPARPSPLASAAPLAAGFVDLVNTKFKGNISRALADSTARAWAQSIGLIDRNDDLKTALCKDRIDLITRVMHDGSLNPVSKLDTVRILLKPQ